MKVFDSMHEWSMRHAFYWNMGAVWLLLKGHPTSFPVNAAQQ
jgi:hypothetical protein